MAYKATDIQNALNKQGYNLAVDGIIGPKTTAAIKDYQQKNGLAVDGIVGPNTWGALNKAQTGSPSASAPAATAPTQAQAPTFEHKPSDAVAQADALLQQQLANKPGEWQGGTWTDNLNDTINQILNREKFSYDLNGDMLYQQYKDQYTTQGKLAMMDTMGQAAAMTGGYGNSYAQTAGQQAYQGYLQQLNDVVPELYGMAQDQYNQEGQNLYSQASLMAQMDEQEYGRYQDKLSQYYTDLNYLTENARYMSETEYQKALDDFNIKYGSYRDAVADDQWKQTYDYQKDRDLVADDQWQKTFDEGVRQFDATHGLNTAKAGLAYDGNGGYYTANPGWDTETIKAFQEAHNLEVDGIWGPKTAAAYDVYNAGSDIDYSDWDAGDWEGYFARIRQSEGEAAAQEELQHFTSKGLIPKNMVTYAAIGARGGQMGH